MSYQKSYAFRTILKLHSIEYLNIRPLTTKYYLYYFTSSCGQINHFYSLLLLSRSFSFRFNKFFLTLKIRK